MKTIYTTMFCIAFVCSLSAQLGNKINTKKLGTTVSVKPSNVKLKNVAVPKNFDISKASKLKVPQSKLKLTSRKKVKITPTKPYTTNLHIEFNGDYYKNYFSANTGIIYYNAQRGKEYRMKVILADRKHLVQNTGSDIPENAYILVKVGNQREWSSIPVNRANREFNLVFQTAVAGRMQIILGGLRTPNRDGGEDWWFWLPMKSIQVDEI